MPNAWGLFDCHGNVSELCLDWFGDYDAGAATDPAGAASGSHRESRGGHWGGPAYGCRSAARRLDKPTWMFGYLGLRLAIIQSE